MLADDTREAREDTSLDSIRIVLADLPQMLRSIIRDILLSEPDMEIVGELPGQAELPAMVERTGATFVIVRQTGLVPPAIFQDLLAAQPPTRVLAIADEGRGAVLYELQPRRIPIGELSAARLVAAIRDKHRSMAEQHEPAEEGRSER
jgi:DNA-binding NarL/FixJ family response regulator